MGKLPQVAASFAATVGSFGLGTGLAWSSTALPYLIDCNEKNGEHVEGHVNCTYSTAFTTDEGSWIGSLFPVGALIASFIAGLLLPKIGRKWTMIALCIPFIIGWICLLIPAYQSDVSSPALFYVGRILTGMGGGGFALAPPVYISEITETSIKGAMGSVMQFMLTIGIALVYAMGIENALDWGVITIVCVIPPALSGLAMFFMPDSPYFLISKGKEGEALKALQWLRGTTEVKGELEELKRSHRAQLLLGDVSYLDLVKKQVYLKPFLIMIALMFFQQWSGINAVLFYLKDVFIKAGSTIDAGLSSFIIGIVQVVATGLAIIIVDRFGRKPLLALSSIVMCLSIITLGVFFYLDENKQCIYHNVTLPNNTVITEKNDTNCKDDGIIDSETVESLGSLPLISLMVYVAAFSIGFGPLPWAVNAEMFPQEAKDKGSSLITLFNWLCAFLVSKYSVNITDALNPSGGYFLFGAVCLLGTFFVIFLTPETKGKTNEDMRNYFLGQSPNKTGLENANYQEDD